MLYLLHHRATFIKYCSLLNILIINALIAMYLQFLHQQLSDAHMPDITALGETCMNISDHYNGYQWKRSLTASSFDMFVDDWYNIT